MRLKPETDGLDHDSLDIGVHEHHPRAVGVSILDITTSISAFGSFNLDVTLPDGKYQVARIVLLGGKKMTLGSWRECAEVHATRDSDEAVATSIEDAISKRVYSVCYSKQNGDTYLSQKIFDNNSSRIYLQDAVLTGSVLRLTFKNSVSSATTLWVKGQVLAF